MVRATLVVHHAGAFVIAEIASQSPTKWAKRGSVDAFVTLADCSRTITLDFGGTPGPELRNAVQKARLLRDLFDAYCQELERAVDDLTSPTTD